MRFIMRAYKIVFCKLGFLKNKKQKKRDGKSRFFKY